MNEPVEPISPVRRGRYSSVAEMIRGMNRMAPAEAERQVKAATSPRPNDRRYDAYGPRVVMAVAGCWLMVRRPRATPCVMHAREWDALSVVPPKEVQSEQ